MGIHHCQAGKSAIFCGSSDWPDYKRHADRVGYAPLQGSSWKLMALGSRKGDYERRGMECSTFPEVDRSL
jgi:hypothetical protein